MRSLESEAVSQDGSCEVHDSRRSRRWIGLIALAALAVALFAFIPSADALAEGRFPTGVAAPTSTETCPSSPGVDGLAPGVQPPAWAEHQFVHFFMRPQAGGACPLAGVAGEHGEILQYQGGPVQHSPQLFLLFWGSNFESGVGLKLSEAFHLFYGNLKSENEVKGSTAAWQGIVDQYWSNEGPVYHNAKIAAEGHITSVTAPKNVTYALLDKTISEWVESVKTNYHLTPNQNAQFVVLTAPGSTFNKEVLPKETVENEKHEKEILYTCGFHKTTGPYTGEHKNEFYSYSLVPYNGDSHCGEEGTKTETEEEKLINGTTDTASHEFAEAVTDPQSSREYSLGERNPYTSSVGWTGKGGNEIADECEKKPGARLPYRSWVTLLWDDLGGYEKGSPEGECKLEDPPYAAPSAPSATTGVATGITATGATVAGTVNPNGPDAHYYFEYGPTTSYGTKIPTPPGNDAGFGTSPVRESATPTGLKPCTPYHYRVVANSWVGTTYGGDKEFTTLASPPSATTEAAESIGENHATLHGTVDPGGCATSYQFEYWKAGKSKEVTKVPVTAESVGSGTNGVRVTQKPTGLAPFTEYIYRVAATNTGGTTRGAELSFVTGPFLASQITPNPSGATEINMSGVSCSALTACVGVGFDKSGETDVPLGERWNGVEWTLQSMPTPSGAKSTVGKAVSCSSSTACTAVGYYVNSSGLQVPLAERWNGTEWAIQSIPGPSGSKGGGLYGVSCSSATACTAVGYYTNTGEHLVTLAESWNGSQWSIQTSRNEGEVKSILLGVSCSSVAACTAVGTGSYGALVERWSGTEWVTQKAAKVEGESQEQFSGVSCTTATVCIAVGSSRKGSGGSASAMAQSWNGSEWALRSAYSPSGAKESFLEGLSCFSSTVCTAVGHYLNSMGTPSTLAEDWNGTEWKPHATANPFGAKSSELHGVSCTSAVACTAVGRYMNSSEAFVTLAEATGPPIATAKSAASITNSAATLNGIVNPLGWETTYHFEYGTTIAYGTKIPVPDAKLGSETAAEGVSQAITGLRPETTYHYRVVATSGAGTTNGEDGTFTTTRGWSIVPTPNPSGARASYLEGVSCSSTTACLAVGYDKNSAGVKVPLGERWSGEEWQLQTMPVPTGAKSSLLEDVSCSSSTVCTAVGWYENSSELQVPLAERWNGTEWAIQFAPGPSGSNRSGLYGVSCSSSTACTAVGWYINSSGYEVPLAEQWNGTEWTIQSVPTEGGLINTLYGVSCTSATACTAVGAAFGGSLVERWNGTEWTLQKAAKINELGLESLRAVSCAAATMCAAGGSEFFDEVLVESWNGTGWSLQSAPTPDDASKSTVNGMSCSSSTACTAVGGYHNYSGVNMPLAENWNGTEWRIQTPVDPSGSQSSEFGGVSCISSTTCIAVGGEVNSAGVPVTLVEATGGPIATTEPATSVTATGATLNATVIPDGWETTYHFEYGTTISYGTKAPIPDATVGSETVAEKVSHAISGLQSKTIYHYRIVATNAVGASDGEDHTFTTTG